LRGAASGSGNGAPVARDGWPRETGGFARAGSQGPPVGWQSEIPCKTVARRGVGKFQVRSTGGGK